MLRGVWRRQNCGAQCDGKVKAVGAVSVERAGLNRRRRNESVRARLTTSGVLVGP